MITVCAGLCCRWTGIFAYNATTNQMVKNCLYLRSKETDAGLLEQFFGSCGSVPTNFVGIPTAACLEKAGKCRQHVLQVDSWNSTYRFHGTAGAR